MGMRFRKSVSIGGFRINVSKSGIGYSYGVKGARVTRTASGRKRTTLSVPGTGLSYVTETSGKKKKDVGLKKTVDIKANDAALSNVINTDIVNVDEIKSAQFEELLKEINKAFILGRIGFWLIMSIFLVGASPLFILTCIAGVVLYIYTRRELAVEMEYEFDDESKLKYDELVATWNSINKCKRLWQVLSEQKIAYKKNAGANILIKPVDIKAAKKLPYFINSNVQPFGLKLRRKQIFFLPDKVFIVAGKVTAVTYDTIGLRFGTTKFVETKIVPKDAKIVGKTWRYVNKNGQPDKRYKSNKQFPICEYGEILISSGSALNVRIMCSNSSIIPKIEEDIKKIDFGK